LARELGAAWVGGAEDQPPVPLDSSVIFAPAGWIVPEALRDLDKGGTLAINAIHMTPIPEFPYDLIYYERTVRSVANSTRQDAEGLLQVAAEIPIRPEVTLFPLSQANQVLGRLKRSEIDGAAALQIS
jgi:propanol-preferring alcohol dehydrogenase